MKKISFLFAIIGTMIASVPNAKAQNIQFSTTVGAPLYQGGFIQMMDPHVGFLLGADFASHYLQGYVEGYGGDRKRALLPGKTLAMKDTLQWRTINISGLSFGLAFCIPQGGEDGKKLNRFRGRILALDVGPGFNSFNQAQATAFRIHLQGNYMFGDSNKKKCIIGVHARVSYSYLYLSLPDNSYPLDNVIVGLGLTVEIPNALGSSNRYD